MKVAAAEARRGADQGSDRPDHELFAAEPGDQQHEKPEGDELQIGDVDFTIEGPHANLDSIVFRGDAISLRGKGEMGFDSQIRMTLHAMIGRGELNLPVLQDVSGKASEQIMLVHVNGSLQDPQVTNEALPMVNRFFQFFQFNR